MRTDALRTLRWKPADYHARALLDRLQGPDGRTGTIPHHLLRLLYLDMCHEIDLEPMGWNAVAREFRKVLGDRKHHLDTRRGTVYRIPPVARMDCQATSQPPRGPVLVAARNAV